MARKKVKRKATGQVKLARPEWARFCAGYHGKGAHRNLNAYRRKDKHPHNDGAYSDE